MYNNYHYRNQNRIGGFFGPFLLSGITGGLLAPSFYRPYPPRPIYGPYPPYRPIPPYMPYGPY